MTYGNDEQAELDLIAKLLDKGVELRVRDDCAEELAKYSSLASESALESVGADNAEDDILLDTCGTSLGERWVREGRLNVSGILRLSPVARRIAEAILENHAPALFQQLISVHKP
jgi:hypothetical protein